MPVTFFLRRTDMRQLLIVPVFTCIFFAFSCQKTESSSAPQPDPAANAGDAVGHGSAPPYTGPIPGSDAAQPSVPLPPSVEPGEPAPEEPVPTQGLIALTIASQGAFLVGQKKKLKAMAYYKEPAVSREAPALWSLTSNEADASLAAEGIIVAKRPGKIRVKAEFADQIAEAELDFILPMLNLQEEQFWVYRLEKEKLSFNSPWDREAGSAIIRSAENLPSMAIDCLQRAKDRFAELQSQAEVKNRLDAVLVRGATPQLIFMVNVVPVDGRRNDLRRLDRDAYFWHWTREDLRPSLAMSIFQEGAWVWEAIVSPGACVQPDKVEVLRYLDYVITRLPAAE